MFRLVCVHYRKCPKENNTTIISATPTHKAYADGQMKNRDGNKNHVFCILLKPIFLLNDELSSL